MPARRLNLEGGGHEAVCQQGHWASMGGGLGGLTSIGEGNECHEDTGTRRRVDCEIPHHSGENETFFIRVWKPLFSRRVLKTLRESSKRKAQREQYLLVVDFGHYKWYQS